MKKLLLATVLFACSAAAFGQGFAIPIANDSTTGTVAKKPCRLVATGSTPSVVNATSVSDLQVIGICGDGAGTTGNVMVQVFGIVSKKCTFDNATTYGHYVQVASGGGCHDAGASKPTSGTILGTVFDVGGAAGDYVISLNKDIYPASATAAALCNVIGSSDTLTAAGTFATTCSISGLVQGALLEIRAHGVLSTTATASPLENIQVNAGGTAGICSHTANNTPVTNETNQSWDVVCFIHILTTGAPGTASTWGTDTVAQASNGTFASRTYSQGAATESFTTNSAQTLSIQITSTLVSGQSFTLQSLLAWDRSKDN